MSPFYVHLPVYVALCLRGQCKLSHSSRWNCKTIKLLTSISLFNVSNYLHTGNVLTTIADASWTLMKKGNIVLRIGIEPTLLAFQASVQSVLWVVITN